MSEITYPYLDRAIDQIVVGLEQLSADWYPRPPVLRVIDTAIPPPVWWLYPGELALSDVGSQTSLQGYVVNMRLIIGYQTEGYDASLVPKLWTWMPQTINFWNARRSLVLLNAENGIRYLQPSSARLRTPLPFGASSSGSHVGVTFPMELSFLVSQDPVYGN